MLLQACGDCTAADSYTAPTSPRTTISPTSATFAVTTTAVATSTPVTLTASYGGSSPTATLTVNAPISIFNGIVQTQTLISQAVVSASYTPGAGNIW